MSYFPKPAPAYPLHKRGIIVLPTDSTYCPLGGPFALLPSAASTTWTTISLAIAIPFTVFETITVVKLGWVNGTTPADNADIALYDASFNLLVSAGSTACGAATANAWQWVNTADVTLTPGQYYIGHVKDAGSVNSSYGWTNLQMTAAMPTLGGARIQSSAFPLPNPFVGTISSGGRAFPVLGMALDTTYA